MDSSSSMDYLSPGVDYYMSTSDSMPGTCTLYVLSIVLTLSYGISFKMVFLWARFQCMLSTLQTPVVKNYEKFMF